MIWAILIIIVLILVLFYIVGVLAEKDVDVGSGGVGGEDENSLSTEEGDTEDLDGAPRAITDDTENLLNDIRNNLNVDFSESESATFSLSNNLDPDQPIEEIALVHGGKIEAEGLSEADITKVSIYLRGRGFTPDQKGFQGGISDTSNKSLERYEMNGAFCSIGTARVSDGTFHQSVFCGVN